MNVQIEKLQQLFEQGKQDPAALNDFFEEFWPVGDSLPRQEMRKLIDSVLNWAQVLVPPRPEVVALATTASGLASYHEGNFGASLKKFAEARKLFEDIQDEEGVFATEVGVGGCYRSLGDIELALKHLLNAAQQLPKIKRFQHIQVACLYAIGEIYSSTGQFDEALKYHQLCEKHIIDCKEKNKQMLCRVLAGVGGIYQHQKKYSLALDYLNRSLKLTEETNTMSVKARALTDLGSYYFEMGDLAAAADYQSKALAIRNEMNIPNAAVTNMIFLAEISVKLHKPDEAIDFLSKALKIADELQVKQKMYQIHLIFSQIYRIKGDLLKALFHFEAYHNIREEVQHEDNEKKIMKLKLIFEAEQTMKENAIIKKQKAEIQKKNVELQETIDELTLTRVNKTAKTITLLLAVVLFIFEDPIIGFSLNLVSNHSYPVALTVKMAVIFSLSPINKTIEKFLLKNVIKKKKKYEKFLT